MAKSGKQKANEPRKHALREVTDTEIDDVAREFAQSAAASATDLHALFNRQVRDILDNAGLAEEEKQSILVAMSCPCCGGGAASFTYKLRSDR